MLNFVLMLLFQCCKLVFNMRCQRRDCYLQFLVLLKNSSSVFGAAMPDS